jgi:hypothetical protein
MNTLRAIDLFNSYYEAIAKAQAHLIALNLEPFRFYHPPGEILRGVTKIIGNELPNQIMKALIESRRVHPSSLPQQSQMCGDIGTGVPMISINQIRQSSNQMEITPRVSH